MKKHTILTMMYVLFGIMILSFGQACSDSDNSLTEREIRQIIREELSQTLTTEQVRLIVSQMLGDNVSEARIRQIIQDMTANFVTQSQVNALISKLIGETLSEDYVRNIIIEELKSRLTDQQIISLIEEMSGKVLSEAEIRKIIQEEVDKTKTGWEVINYTVNKSAWEWNTNAEQYEAVFDLEQLTEFIYKDGAILGYVFIGEQGKDEVQKTLPYINTYKEKLNDGTIITYTETISFDVQYAANGKSTVAFFIKASDLARADEYLANYKFRIVLIY